MFKGNIFYTNDENLAMNTSYNKNYIVIALVDDSDVRFGKGQVKNIHYLLPPYLAFEAENLGNMEEFKRIYYDHLNRPETESYLCLLFRALYDGYNVLIFIDEDEMQLSFPNTLFEFIRYKYGLIVGNQTNDCLFDTDYEDIVRLSMYKFHYIKAQDVIDHIRYPIRDPYICSELCDELGISNNGDPIQTIDQYIKDDRYNSRIKQYTQETKCNWYIKGEVK